MSSTRDHRSVTEMHRRLHWGTVRAARVPPSLAQLFLCAPWIAPRRLAFADTTHGNGGVKEDPGVESVRAASTGHGPWFERGQPAYHGPCRRRVRGPRAATGWVQTRRRPHRPIPRGAGCGDAPVRLRRTRRFAILREPRGWSDMRGSYGERRR